MKKSTLKDFMSNEQRTAMGNLPTTHQNMKDKTGVCRAGKTARDKANKG